MAALLIITLPLPQIVPALPKVLKAAANHAVNKLYIHFDPLLRESPERPAIPLSYKSYIVSSIYSKSPCLCPNKDIHILLQGLKDLNRGVPKNFTHNISKVLIDFSDGNFHPTLENKYKHVLKDKEPFFLIKGSEMPGFPTENIKDFADDKVYNDVAIGGTFDRLHPGHKILLSEAVLRTTKRLTIGVSDVPLLKKKILKELIESCSIRMETVREFLVDIDEFLEYNILEIEDPLGPTAWDSKIEMIVVSEETKKGVDVINAHRKESSLNPLEMYCIQLFDDCNRNSPEEEAKFSSSSQRMRLLGDRFHEPTQNSNIPSSPYIIGLTGGSASGKSRLAARLSNKGAGIIDCDKLGHKAYLKGMECFQRIIETFGNDIVDASGEIDRKMLGSIVFSSPEKLDLLNKIVWPEIGRLAAVEVENYRSDGYKIVVLDAAVLLEARWQVMCHEVWVCIVKEDEAIRRIMERDGKREEEASKRIKNQMSNPDRLTYANVVFSTQWSYEYTQSQVDKAWNVLHSEGRLAMQSNI